MRNGSKLWPHLIVGALVGVVVFWGGLLLLQEMAVWILSLNPVSVGGVGAVIGGVVGIVLWVWKRVRKNK